MISHRHFLIHDLVFRQNNITMKPEVIDKVTLKNLLIRQIDMGSNQ